MWWFKYEKILIIVTSATLLAATLIVSVSSWRKVAKTDAAVNLVTALTTNMVGRVTIHVDIELGGTNAR